MPGMANTEIVENAADRTRGGATIESIAKNAGASVPIDAASSACIAMAIDTCGAYARTTSSRPSTTPTIATNRSRKPGSRHGHAGDAWHRDEHADDLQRLDRRPRSRRGPRCSARTRPRRRATAGSGSRTARCRGTAPRARCAGSSAPGAAPASSPTPARGRSAICAGPRRAPAAQPLVHAAHRLAQPQREHDEHQRRDGEDEERRPPPEPQREHTGDERSEDLADRVRLPVDGEHLHPRFGRVVVGEQRRVRRRHDRATAAGADPHRDEHRHGDREAGADGEQRPDRGADRGDADPVAAVAVERERHLDEQHRDRRDRDDGERARVASARSGRGCRAAAPRTRRGRARRPR